jgi:hypothetical protein
MLEENVPQQRGKAFQNGGKFLCKRINYYFRELKSHPADCEGWPMERIPPTEEHCIR